MTDAYVPAILVADDEEIQRNILREILLAAGHPVDSAASVEEAVAKLEDSLSTAHPYDIVLTDLKMPGSTEGLDLLRQVKEILPHAEVILMTAYSEVRSAVQAMKLGAFEYLPKPFDKERLLHVMEQATEKLALVHENQRLRRLVESGEGMGRMVGHSPAMQELFSMVARVAQTSSTCLIRGESGTGKELVARAIHGSGPRASKPFIAINCAAIPETLIESELFGHEKGVFTGATNAKPGLFEEVGEGTLFLDEIGSMKFDLQAKLLRVIQEREFSRLGSTKLIPFQGRIVAATAQDLESLIEENRFREDLYFRLNVVPLEIPPLRERTEDIPILVESFIKRCNERLGLSVKGITPSVLEAFEVYRWPGNVRELENCIERMIVLGGREILDESLLPASIRRARRHAVAGEHADSPPSNGQFALPEEGVVMEDIEADLIRQALERTNGRIEPAAQLLGITYKTLQYRIKKYELDGFKALVRKEGSV